MKQEEFFYHLGKTIAEKSAFDFVKQNKTSFDVVSILPGMVLGELLRPVVNTGVEFIEKYLSGRVTSIQTNSWPVIDVIDVVQAYILCMEKPSAHGRYLVIERYISEEAICALLQPMYPSMKLDPVDKDFVSLPAKKFSYEKIKSLGVQFQPIQNTLQDTIRGLKQLDLI